MLRWRIYGRLWIEGFEDVEARHALPVATADDIDLPLEAKARFYGRLSDECIYDVRDVEAIVRELGRRRYRE